MLIIISKIQTNSRISNKPINMNPKIHLQQSSSNLLIIQIRMKMRSHIIYSKINRKRSLTIQLLNLPMNFLSQLNQINDVTMIRNSALGIAMANAVDAVKQIADVTTEDHREDGVANALERISAGEWIV